MAKDEQWKQVGAHLLTKAAPFDPWDGSGHKRDSAHYMEQPGVDFMRPWLAVQDGPAFQWPLGMQGYTDSIQPALGIHRYLGDAGGVDVDVLHAGEEHVTLSGYFAGDTAPDNIIALRQVVTHQPAPGGKILYLPEIAQNPWRVQVVTCEFDRAIDDRDRDNTYQIEFVRIGLFNKLDTGDIVPTPPGSRTVKVNAKHRTLRSIAKWKLNNANKWRILYEANQKWFVKHHVNYHKAPTYKLPIGLKLHY